MTHPAKQIQNRVTIAIIALFAWIGIGTLAFHKLESWTWIQSFYYSVVTVTTVGYGDLVPTTPASKLFAAIYILIGVTIGIATLGTIGTKIIDHREYTSAKKKKKR